MELLRWRSGKRIIASHVFLASPPCTPLDSMARFCRSKEIYRQSVEWQRSKNPSSSSSKPFFISRNWTMDSKSGPPHLWESIIVFISFERRRRLEFRVLTDLNIIIPGKPAVLGINLEDGGSRKWQGTRRPTKFRRFEHNNFEGILFRGGGNRFLLFVGRRAARRGWALQLQGNKKEAEGHAIPSRAEDRGGCSGQTQEDASYGKAAGLPATLLNEVVDLFVNEE